MTLWDRYVFCRGAETEDMWDQMFRQRRVEGRPVRLLGVRRSQDPDDPDRLVISMVGTSEWYPLGS